MAGLTKNALKKGDYINKVRGKKQYGASLGIFYCLIGFSASAKIVCYLFSLSNNISWGEVRSIILIIWMTISLMQHTRATKRGI